MREAVKGMMRGSRRRSSLGARAALVPAALLLGCATARPAPILAPPGGDVHGGRAFAILCHFPCGAAGELALRAADLTWSRAAALLGVSAASPAVIRPINLYRTEREYEEIEQALTGGRFRLNRAMTYRGVEAHISVHPNLTEEALQEYGLTANTLRVIAHEAAHIAIRTMNPRSRDLPDWFDEGIASSLEVDVLLALGLADSREGEPVSSTRLHLLRERIRRDALPPLHELLAGDETGLTLSERYAFYQHFMDFLRTGRWRNRLSQVLHNLDAAGGSAVRVRTRIMDLLFGAGGEVDRADAEFRAWLLDREPVWLQTRRTLSTAGREWLQVGFARGAEAWHQHPVAAPPYVLRGGVRVLNGSGSVLIGLEDGAHVAVVFAAGEVRVERYDRTGDPAPGVLGRRAHAVPIADRPLPFRVAVDPGRIAVTIGAAPVLEVPAAGVDGRWGLATGPGANVVWSDFRFERPR